MKKNIIEAVTAALPPMGTTGQVAEFLGWSPKTLRRHVLAGEIASVKLGDERQARVLIPRSAVVEYLLARAGV